MKDMKYVIFGITENTLSRIWPYLNNCNLLDQILYFCDNNKAIHYTMMNGYTVYPPEKLKEDPEATVILAAMSVNGIATGLRKMGINNKLLTYPWFRFTYVDRELNHDNIILNSEYMFRKMDEIAQLYNMEDDYTKRILNQIVKQRKNLKYEFVETDEVKDFASVHDYFYDESLAPKGKITFVDAGAFNGDSVESTYNRYGDRIKRIYTFEPDKQNYYDLEMYIKNRHLENITTNYMCGLSDKDEEAYLEDGVTDAMSIKISNSQSESYNKIQLRTLDSLNIEVVGDLLIKMDIEGSELVALKGAKETIQKHTPYLAICLYHKMEDILEIPKYIRSINPNYNLYIRAGGHLECYAVPKER